MTKKEIQSITRELILQYSKEKKWKNIEEFRIDLQELYELVIYPLYECQLITRFDLGWIDDKKILGKYLAKDNLVLIDKSLRYPCRDPRFSFTLGHEFGHAIIHKTHSSPIHSTALDIFPGIKQDQLEIEANCFAENLLMPDNYVYKKFWLCYQNKRKFRYVGETIYWFYQFGIDYPRKVRNYTEFCSVLGEPLCLYFGNVSKSSLGLKLHKLGLVNNQTDEKYGEFETNRLQDWFSMR